MSDELTTALISAAVALLAAGGTALLTWRKTRQELAQGRIEWLTGLTADSSIELLKKRLETYPEALAALARLSEPARTAKPLHANDIEEIGLQLNAWLYSAGGLCATEFVRGPLVRIRDICSFEWTEGPPPEELLAQKDAAEEGLRKDVFLKGREALPDQRPPSMMDELQQQVNRLRRTT